MKDTRKPEAAIALLLFAGFGAGTALGDEDESSPTAAETKISQEQAAKIALAQVPGGTVKEAELESTASWSGRSTSPRRIPGM
jgi:uncharacterized membrane protein YkoI